MAVSEYIGARYVPQFAEPADWNDVRTYEPLTIVLHEGNSYTSKQFVPKGVALTDERYWAETGNYNAQVEGYREEVLANSAKIETLEWVNDNSITKPLIPIKMMAPFRRFINNGSKLKNSGFVQDVLLFEKDNVEYLLLGLSNTDESVYFEIIRLSDNALIYSENTDKLYHSLNAFIKDENIYCYNANTKTLYRMNISNILMPILEIYAKMPLDSPAYNDNFSLIINYNNDEIIITNGVRNYIYSINGLAFIRNAPAFNDTSFINGGCSDENYIYLMNNFPNTIYVVDKETFQNVYKIPIGQRAMYYTYSEAESLFIRNGVLYTAGELIAADNKITNIVKFDMNVGEPFSSQPVYESWPDFTVYVDNNVDLNSIGNYPLMGTAAHPFKFIEDAIICAPANSKINIVIQGDYPYIINAPSKINTITGNNTTINGLIISHYNDITINNISIKRNVNLFSTYRTAIRVYNGRIHINNVTFLQSDDNIDDDKQFNVYLNNYSELYCLNDTISRLNTEKNTLARCKYLLPPYFIKGSLIADTFTFFHTMCAVPNNLNTSAKGTFIVQDTSSIASNSPFLVTKNSEIILPYWVSSLECQTSDAHAINFYTIQLSTLKNNANGQTCQIQPSANLVIKFQLTKVNGRESWASNLKFVITSILQDGNEVDLNTYIRGVCQ